MTTLDSTIGTISLQQQSLDGLSSPAANDDARETARQFEALLLKTMLKSMRASTPGDSLLNSEQAGHYLDMLDQQIAQEISKSGSFGLQNRIYQQLAGQTIAPSTNTNSINALTQGQPVRSSASQSIDYFQPAETGPAAFINRIQSDAQRAAREIGTSTEAVIAIAALETGWGKHVPLKDDGSSSNNLFGIKADQQWRGESSNAPTLEFVNGEMRGENAMFRAYSNEHQSINDFTNFIQENPRYQQALQVSDKPEQFLRALQNAGYATDPDYADKTISIMRSINSLQSN